MQSEEASNSVNDFSQIYDGYYSRIYNYIRLHIVNPSIADDLTSQTFERVCAKLHTYCKDKGSISAWLYKIAQNIVWDYLRANKKHTIVSLEAVYDISDNSSEFEDDICIREIKKNLLEALSNLNEKDRDLIILKFWSDMTNREIAEFTGLTESNVGVKIFRALRKLKSVLESLGVDIIA
jgi:RNA polymerase sigma-70 factor (ECF subfamily)